MRCWIHLTSHRGVVARLFAPLLSVALHSKQYGAHLMSVDWLSIKVMCTDRLLLEEIRRQQQPALLQGIWKEVEHYRLPDAPRQEHARHEQ